MACRPSGKHYDCEKIDDARHDYRRKVERNEARRFKRRGSCQWTPRSLREKAHPRAEGYDSSPIPAAPSEDEDTPDAPQGMGQPEGTVTVDFLGRGSQNRERYARRKR